MWAYMWTVITFFWYSSLPSGKFRVNVLNYTTAASFHVVCNSLFTVISFNRVKFGICDIIINHALTLAFKFQLLPKTEEF